MMCPYLINNKYCSLKTCTLYSRIVSDNITSETPLTVTTTKITNSNDNINVYLQIPVFHGNINPEILNNINRNVNDDVMEYKSEMESAAEENAKGIKKQANTANSFRISNTYNVTYNKNSILSFFLLYHQYISGKNSFIKIPYNYNLQTGESMSLSDLFKTSVECTQILTSKAKEYISANFPDSISQFKGILEDQPYYIDNDTLILFLKFNESVGDNSDIPLIKIPLSDLNSILKPGLIRSSY